MLNIPTLKTIVSRMTSNLESRLTGKTSLLPVALLRILIIVFALVVHVLYGTLLQLAKFILPDYENLTEKWANRHGKTWGVPRKAASNATGSITITGVEGVVIPKGTLFHRDDNSGVEYKTVEEKIIPVGLSIICDIISVEPGENTNYLKSNPSDILQLYFVSAPLNVDDPAFVNGEIAGGQDLELLSDWQKRILFRIQEPGAGSNEGDFIRWATSVNGVEKAWNKANYFGASTSVVLIYPVSEELEILVKNYIDPRQSVICNHTIPKYVFSVTKSFMVYYISIDSNTEANQTKITKAIDDFHLDEGDPGGTLLIGNLRQAIKSTGIFDYEITAISKDGNSISVDDIDFIDFEFPFLQEVVFASLN